MQIQQTFEYKLYPTRKQKKIFNQWLEVSCEVWNRGLARIKNWCNSRSGAKPNYSSLCKDLTEDKKTHNFLKLCNAQALQQVLKRLNTAFQAYLNKKRGLPRFKKLGRIRSLFFPQMEIGQLKANAIILPSIGLVKIRLSRPVPANFELGLVQVVNRASGWYLLLTLKLNVTAQKPIPHGKAVGIDLGLSNYVATSSEDKIPKPKFFKTVRRKLKSLQSKLRNKKIGSSNWQKIQNKIARLHEYRCKSRRDFQFKTAHKICHEFGIVFVENLSINPMLKGACRYSILEASWGEFLDVLEWVCWKRGVYFHKVPPQYTSQICPNCQLQTGKKKLSNRIHRCRGCGYTIDRDVAAAQVVLQRGLAAVGLHGQEA